ncbi:MAG: class III signal peptide-containing protein [Candidatus Omnitrophota bacterium]
MIRQDKQKYGGFQKKAQITVEYSVMFVALVAVIIIASTKFIAPAVNRFFNGVSNIVDNATTEMQGKVVAEEN